MCADLRLWQSGKFSVEVGDLFVDKKKRIKMQEMELDSCFQEVSGFIMRQEDVARVSNENAKNNVDATQLVRTVKETPPVLIQCDTKVDGVNKKADVGYNPPRSYVQSVVGVDMALLGKKKCGVPNVSCAKAKDVGVFSEKDVAYSSNSNPLYPCKKVSRTQCDEMSQCGSVSGPPRPKNPLEVWKEMKQNGFLSSSHSQKVVTIPPVKSCVRKTKAEVIKKKMELARIEQAKKEQVDRFTKIAAPSGLLNELNPGIINHVRNSKQVHSILKALVRPEGHDVKAKAKKEFGFHQHAHCENGVGSSLAHGRVTSGHQSVKDNSYNVLQENDVGLESRVVTDSLLFQVRENEDFRVPSRSKVPENAGSIYIEDDPNCVSSLSVKAASVASQWLELLQHDIKGRLAALKRSKKRVHAVLHTELPHLLSNEFHSIQENEPCVVKSPTPDPQSSMAKLHETKWKSLFGQMDTTLADEEQQLESCLEQIRGMQLLCDRGLYSEHHGVPAYFQSLQGSASDLRLKMGNSDMVLAVRAAAASIYSTCNFMMEKENIGCSQTG